MTTTSFPRAFFPSSINWEILSPIQSIYRSRVHITALSPEQIRLEKFTYLIFRLILTLTLFLDPSKTEVERP